MLDQELVQETIQDLQEVKEKILTRHQGETTFTLRVDTVFNTLINSLAHTTGNVVNTTRPGKFEPQPLTSIAGAKIVQSGSNLPKLEKVIDVDKAAAIKEQIQLIHDSFQDREDSELLENLKDWQIKGVAKVAGIKDFETASIDGGFVRDIKDKIQANKEEAAAKDKLKNDLKEDGTASKAADTKTKETKVNPGK